MEQKKNEMIVEMVKKLRQMDNSSWDYQCSAVKAERW